MRPEVVGFFDEETFTVSYVVADAETRHCAIIDSVLDFDPASGRTRRRSAEKLLAHIAARHLEVEWILETHVHADHLSAGDFLKARLGAKLGIGEHVATVQQTFGAIFEAGGGFARDGRQFDRLFKDGDTFPIGRLTARVMHTPGHTPACISYVIGDAVFVGDTLFMPDYGTARCDFPGGDAAELYRSIRRIFALPPETRMFLCHDYKAPGRDEYRWETTVGEQRARNVHIHDGISEAEFVAMRTERDKKLTMPKLILPAVQVNMDAGRVPKFLKIPVDVL
ncbi:MAG TPA: MBL fold metallo-hydrolase [Dongiaceae bacterium]|jgi:glyoxylase-like metal-dependent hydrolase (beta-lactamase superfamily II)|nr:MBL fold metallo-hydrolase [Dongiaceae bacterium]